MCCMSHMVPMLQTATVCTEISTVLNFVDFTVTYGYSENLIRGNLLVCSN